MQFEGSGGQVCTGISFYDLINQSWNYRTGYIRYSDFGQERQGVLKGIIEYVGESQFPIVSIHFYYIDK